MQLYVQHNFCIRNCYKDIHYRENLLNCALHLYTIQVYTCICNSADDSIIIFKRALLVDNEKATNKTYPLTYECIWWWYDGHILPLFAHKHSLMQYIYIYIHVDLQTSCNNLLIKKIMHTTFTRSTYLNINVWKYGYIYYIFIESY